jgi:hypothetical protein
VNEIVNLKTWSEFGLGGLVIVTLFVFIYYITKQAREERKEWLTAYVTSQEMHDKRQGETNIILQDLNAIIQSKLQAEWSGEERRRNGRVNGLLDK